MCYESIKFYTCAATKTNTCTMCKHQGIKLYTHTHCYQTIKILHRVFKPSKNMQLSKQSIFIELSRNKKIAHSVQLGLSLFAFSLQFFTTHPSCNNFLPATFVSRLGLCANIIFREPKKTFHAVLKGEREQGATNNQSDFVQLPRQGTKRLTWRSQGIQGKCCRFIAFLQGQNWNLYNSEECSLPTEPNQNTCA